MKKMYAILSLLLSFSAYSQSVQLNNLSKDDVEDVTKEFGSNFAHTVVAAPETNGLWGVEIGIVAGRTKSPNFSDVIDASGGEGEDFESLYHAGAFARAHFPYDFFAELSVLPEQEFEDVSIQSQSIAVGWNLGGFFNWPLDVALAASRGTGELSFSQVADLTTTPPTPAAKITFETKTSLMWVGISKTFLFFTPYAKAGAAKIEGDLSATGNILGYTSSQSESVSISGRYMALGANLQLGFIKFGVEASQIIDVRRASAKLSLDF